MAAVARTDGDARARGATRCVWATGTSRHTENDIKNWKGNVTKAGFLPEERAVADRPAGHRLGRRGACRAPRRGGAVRVVVVARQGIRQRRRMAHRLPARHPGPGRTRGAARAHRAPRGVRAAMVGSLPGDGHLRVISAWLSSLSVDNHAETAQQPCRSGSAPSAPSIAPRTTSNTRGSHVSPVSHGRRTASET